MESDYTKNLSEEEKEAVRNAVDGVFKCTNEKEAYAFAVSVNLAVLIKMEKQIREQNEIFRNFATLVVEELGKIK